MKASVFVLCMLLKTSIMFAIYEPFLKARHCEMLLWAASKWNNNVNQNSLLQSMINWKWMPGFLYQTIGVGERASQRIDRKRESVRDGA